MSALGLLVTGALLLLAIVVAGVVLAACAAGGQADDQTQRLVVRLAERAPLPPRPVGGRRTAARRRVVARGWIPSRRADRVAELRREIDRWF